MKARSAIVVGGGIGGLSVAAALRKNGIDVQIFEKASTFKEIGSGLSLTPNGIKALDKIGDEIGTAVRKAGSYQGENIPFPFLDWKGKIKMRTSFEGLEEKYGAPMVAILRTELHSILLDALPQDCLHVDSKFIKYEQDTEKVVASFSNGSTVAADFLVGADGIHSAVRAQILDDNSPPRYLGCSSIRGVLRAPSHDLCQKGRGFLSQGPGLQIFALPVGRSQMFWVATINSAEGIWPSKHPETAKQELLQYLKGWHSHKNQRPTGKSTHYTMRASEKSTLKFSKVGIH